MEKYKKIILLLCIMLAFLPMTSVRAEGDEDEYDYSQDLDQFDFSEIDEVLNDANSVADISFSDMVVLLIEGRFNEFLSTTGNYIVDMLVSEVRYSKDMLWQVIVIAAVSALFTNFADAFENSQVGETGFFISYLMISTLMMAAFLTAYNLVFSVIEMMIEFIMALIPSFYLAVVFTGKSMASVAFYELTAAAAGVVEWLFLKILLPATKVYIAFVTANNMTKDGQLEKFTELIINGVKWCAKSLFGIVIGISVIQNMVLPYADALKTSILTKTLSALPGIGGTIESASGLIFGTANLIKNGIGTAALVFIAALCIIPVLKIFIINLIMQATAALIQPVSDKRITGAIVQYADGMKVLLSVIFYTAAFFMIIIAMVCAFTVPDT